MVLSSLGCSLAGWESCSCVGVCFPDSLLAPLLFWAPAVFPGHPPPSHLPVSIDAPSQREAVRIRGFNTGVSQSPSAAGCPSCSLSPHCPMFTGHPAWMSPSLAKNTTPKTQDSSSPSLAWPCSYRWWGSFSISPHFCEGPLFVSPARNSSVVLTLLSSHWLLLFFLRGGWPFFPTLMLPF